MSTKRIGVFVFYDKDGIVDEYVCFLLKDICKCLFNLCIVVNGFVNDEGRRLLSQFSDDIHIRENTGLDAYSYKMAIVDYIGFNKLSQYDELVLFNDTFYGPFYSFADVFEEMNRRGCVDFWGLTKGMSAPTSRNYYKDGYYPDHIQTFFTVIKRRMFESDVFKQYWIKMPLYKSFDEVVMKHETYFTKLFSDKGFIWDVLCDTERLREDHNNNVATYATLPSESIKYLGLNVLKRKNFVYGATNYQYVSDVLELNDTLKIISSKYNYDLNMIYKNLLRLYGLKKISKTMLMHNCVNAQLKGDEVVDFSDSTFIFKLHEPFFIDVIDSFLSESLNANIIVTTDNADISDHYKNKGLEVLDDNNALSDCEIIKKIENEGHLIRDFIIQFDDGCLSLKRKSKMFKAFNDNWDSMIGSPQTLRSKIDYLSNSDIVDMVIPFKGIISNDFMFSSYISKKRVFNYFDISLIFDNNDDFHKMIIDNIDKNSKMVIGLDSYEQIFRNFVNDVQFDLSIDRTVLGRICFMIKSFIPDSVLEKFLNTIPPDMLKRFLYK